MTAPRLRVVEIRLYERAVAFRLPFRFGVVTLTACPQAIARVRVRVGAREAWGISAEMLAPKWFDKDPKLSNADNFEQLRRAIGHAARLYRDAGEATAFDLFASTYMAQLDAGAADGLNPLVAGYGPALIDRAVLDGLCRIEGVSFFSAMRGNLPGLRQTPLAPDLAGFELEGFLNTLAPAAAIDARHTVGLVDPIAANPSPVGDGLPETLAEVVSAYGQRYFKLKVAGEIEADLARLAEIASVLDRIEAPYFCTLDGNEQYAGVDGIALLWRRVREAPALRRLAASVLFIEQPIARAQALARDLTPLDAQIPVIIDESDASLASFLEARSRGYRGVSSKSCKGLYKSILNRARCAHWNDEAGEPRYFMSAEDLSIQPGVSLQQDLALASLLGLTHVERNGHHYVDGFAGASEAEQSGFLEAHPDIYRRDRDGRVRLRIEGGRIQLGSLDCAGFARAAEPAWRTLAEMQLPD
jgi:hypothetical protein